MICKWCGETLKTGTKTCKRCKREIPAKSDCGGFYDLVPLPGTQPPEVSAPVAPTPVMPEPAPYAAAAPGGGRGTLNPKIVFGGAIAVILILLVMVISLSGKLADANDRIDGLKNDRSGKEDTEATEDTGDLNGFNPTDPAGDTQATKPVGGEIPENMETVTIENGIATLAFDKEHCDALREAPVYFKVVDENEKQVAVISLTLEKTEDDRELTVDVADIAEDCKIDTVSYVDAVNKIMMDPKKPGEPCKLKDGETANITCTLTGCYEDEAQFTIKITDIEIQ